MQSVGADRLAEKLSNRQRRPWIEHLSRFTPNNAQSCPQVLCIDQRVRAQSGALPGGNPAGDRNSRAQSGALPVRNPAGDRTLRAQSGAPAAESPEGDQVPPAGNPTGDRASFLGVAVDTPLRQLFDYRAPADGPALAPGHRVWVPFGRRRVIGVVVEARDHSEVAADKLRTAFEAADAEPTFDTDLLALLTWAADYYRHPVGEVLASALPVMLRGGAPVREERFLWRLT